MAAKKKSANPPEFPFKGNDGEKRRAAQRMAEQGLRRRKFKGDSVLPNAVAYAVLKDVQDRRTNKRSFDAFIEHAVSQDLDNEAERRFEPNDVFPNRVMSVDASVSYPEKRWATPLAKLQAESEGIEWKEVPPARVKEVKETKLARSDWQNWATEFLLFASELRQLERVDRARKGGNAKARKQRQQPE